MLRFFYVRMLNTRQWTSLRVLNTPYSIRRSKKLSNGCQCPLRLFSSDAFFFTYVNVRKKKTHRWKTALSLAQYRNLDLNILPAYRT